MLTEERTRHSETHQFRMIFSKSLNDNGNLFGGLLMKWMDEVAYITAIRFTRMTVVTVSVDNLRFLKAIKSGSMIETIGRVQKTGNVKIGIQVEIYVETPDSDIREKAAEAVFTFAAINKNNQSICFEKSINRKALNAVVQKVASPKVDSILT